LRVPTALKKRLAIHVLNVCFVSVGELERHRGQAALICACSAMSAFGT